MQNTGEIKILFILGFGPIVRDTAESRFISPEGLLIGGTFTPQMRGGK